MGGDQGGQGKVGRDRSRPTARQCNGAQAQGWDGRLITLARVRPGPVNPLPHRDRVDGLRLSGANPALQRPRQTWGRGFPSSTLICTRCGRRAQSPPLLLAPATTGRTRQVQASVRSCHHSQSSLSTRPAAPNTRARPVTLRSYASFVDAYGVHTVYLPPHSYGEYILVRTSALGSALMSTRHLTAKTKPRRSQPPLTEAPTNTVVAGQEVCSRAGRPNTQQPATELRVVSDNGAAAIRLLTSRAQPLTSLLVLTMYSASTKLRYEDARAPHVGCGGGLTTGLRKAHSPQYVS